MEETVLDLLEKTGEKTYVSMEYGLQTINDNTLKRINRGHSYETFRDAVTRTRARGLEICVHIIIGLPGEDKEDILATARALGEMDIQAVKIHLLYVIRNTVLHELFESGSFQCLPREQYTDIVCDFLGLLPPHVIIHRLTGDPHPEELVAPQCALEKEINLRTIRDNLSERNIWQGKFCKMEE